MKLTSPAHLMRAVLLLLCASVLLQTNSIAQRKNLKLPSADRIIADYVKAVGSRKTLVGITDVTYEWRVADESGRAGTARTQTKATGALRTELSLGADAARMKMTRVESTRGVWAIDTNGVTRTLTDREASAARLTAALLANRLFDYKRANALARTLNRSDTDFERKHNEAAYLVEFTARDNTRVQAWFGAKSRLLLQLTDDANRRTLRFADYRPSSSNGRVLEPHRMEITEARGDANNATPQTLVLMLQATSYNTNLAAALFDPPRTEGVDLNLLLKEVTRRQRRADASFADYTYRVKNTETTLGKGGVVKKQHSSVWEVIIASHGRGGVGKRIMRDDKPLPPEEAAKENARVTAALEKLEKEPPPVPKPTPQQEAKKENEEEKGSGGFTLNLGDFKLRLTDIMRISEFGAPRRETFKGRESVVFDFQPRPGFRPANRSEEAITKLRGMMWIDPADKLVRRFEATLTDNFKIGGGFLMSIRPGASLVYEAQRLPDGFWVPRFYQINANGKALLFSELNVLETQEWSDYKRFRVSTDEAIINAPSDSQEQQP